MRIGVMFDTEKPFDDVVGQVAALADAGIEDGVVVPDLRPRRAHHDRRRLA